VKAGGTAMRWRRLALAVLVGAVAFGAVTLLAVEGKEVVQLRTTLPEGGTRTTRVWVAEADGAMWIEAAKPERPFLHDVQTRPDVELVRGGRVLRLRAVPVPGDTGHQKIRRLLAAKYGWADSWVALLEDTSRSVAIRLEPR
jgi:F420H(2)-dependent quinone reductase